ncbi:MAG TPA: transcription elongation factor GreA [Rectinemataceae bacterium]|nr:transcription elongation factor GreA [Rectinemataceae bacterium]
MADTEQAVNEYATKVQELLNEEKWTRAALSAYTVANFRDLDLLLEDAAREKAVEGVRELCTEHLTHTKNSVIALYLSGVIALKRQQIDDSAMTTLIDLFIDNKKWGIVEFICQRVLEFGENRTALRRLADALEQDNRGDERFEIWERLVKVDYEETEIVKLLAERREREGKIDEAIDFYKKALHRFINKGLFSNVKELWSKLLEACPSDIDFFLHVQRKIAKQISEDKAAGLLLDLYKHYKAAAEWNTALDILRVVIGYDEKNSTLRKEVIECYRGKYSAHSHLEDWLRLSNLATSYRSIGEAMADFEKHIAFDEGNYVFHRTWHVGRIASVVGDEITINFAKSRGHKMSLKMAIDSLTTLQEEHIWVLKARWPKDKLREKVIAEPAWALDRIIRSFGKADLKRIKGELVESVLTQKEWNSWSTKARQVLKDDSNFGNASDSVGTFIVRDRPLSNEEKIYNQFKAQKNFFARVQDIRAFVEKGARDSEFFSEMLAFFTGYVRSFQQVNENVIASYLLLKELAVDRSLYQGSVATGFAEFFDQIENPVAIYDGIKDSRLRAAYVQDIKNFIPDWADVYVRLFPWSLNESLIAALEETGHIDRLKKMVVDIIENYRDHKEAFIWVVKNLADKEWFQQIALSYEKILLTLVHILDISFKEIENHRDTTENKKINKQVQAILFGDGKAEGRGRLEKFLEDSGVDTIERIYALISDVKDLDPSIKMRMRGRIVERFPDFKVQGEEGKEVVSRGLIVTRPMFDEKKKLLDHILTVEVPANSKEIAFALSLGDLRENAEYKAAKEKQDELNARVAKIKNEIERAQEFDWSTVTNSKVSFGTIVTLTNELSGEQEIFTILGPWESDPEHNVISYLSPLGKKLLNHKPGDKLSFSIHERKFQYAVDKIDLAKH